jgi:hypothetical protein
MAASPDLITLRGLNRATLARQGLLERRRLGISDAVKAFGAIQSQHPDWPPVALWTRLNRFERTDLERAFSEKSVVRAGLLRMTLHVMAATDFWPAWTLTQSMRLEQWRLMCKRDPTDPRLVRRLALACEAAVAALNERPLRRDEFTKVLERHAPADLRDLPHRGLSRYFMAVQPLVQVPERGEIYGRGRYATAESWLGASSAPESDPDRARALLIRRHLSAFGPASLADALAWIGRRGGIRPWRATIDAMRDELVELRADDGQTLWDLHTAPRPDDDTPAPPRFLARWDSVLLAHEPKRRTRILPTAVQSTVFTKNADVLPTFLVDGTVAGTWSLTMGDGTPSLVARPFAPLSGAARGELEREAAALIGLMAPDARKRDVKIVAA